MSKLSIKLFGLLKQGTHFTWNYTFKLKMHKMCLLLLWKGERRKHNGYLVFGDKNIENEEFLFTQTKY